jgi:hypothetical protein
VPGDIKPGARDRLLSDRPKDAGQRHDEADLDGFLGQNLAGKERCASRKGRHGKQMKGLSERFLPHGNPPPIVLALKEAGLGAFSASRQPQHCVGCGQE